MIFTLGYGFYAWIAESILWEWRAGFFTLLVDFVIATLILFGSN